MKTNYWFYGCVALVFIVLVLLFMMMSGSSSTENMDQSQPQPQPTVQPQSQPEPKPQVPPPALVLFYGDWCHNCTAMKEAWGQAKAHLSNVVDVQEFESQDAQVMQQNGIEGFPTIRLYPRGFTSGSQEFIPYKGDRSAKSFVDFVHSMGQNY